MLCYVRHLRLGKLLTAGISKPQLEMNCYT